MPSDYLLRKGGSGFVLLSGFFTTVLSEVGYWKLGAFSSSSSSFLSFISLIFQRFYVCLCWYIRVSLHICTIFCICTLGETSIIFLSNRFSGSFICMACGANLVLANNSTNNSLPAGCFYMLNYVKLTQLLSNNLELVLWFCQSSYKVVYQT